MGTHSAPSASYRFVGFCIEVFYKDVSCDENHTWPRSRSPSNNLNTEIIKLTELSAESFNREHTKRRQPFLGLSVFCI